MSIATIIVRIISFLDGLSLRNIKETKSVIPIHKNHRSIPIESPRFLITTNDKNHESQPSEPIGLSFQYILGTVFKSEICFVFAASEKYITAQKSAYNTKYIVSE